MDVFKAVQASGTVGVKYIDYQLMICPKFIG